VKKDLRNKPYLTPNELAELLMVSPVTVRHWANKGWIKAVLTPGGHRRFVRDEVEKFARERGLALEPPDDGMLRVLVVDDEVAICDAVQELLDSLAQSITTETANSGFEAGLSVYTFKPHVVLLDLMMPEMDGFEVCKRLRGDSATKDVRIIAMTGYYSEENRRKILEAGAEHCLKKPLDPDELLSVLGVQDISHSPVSAIR
jgi:excisionase family DNA binding protein